MSAIRDWPEGCGPSKFKSRHNYTPLEQVWAIQIITSYDEDSIDNAKFGVYLSHLTTWDTSKYLEKLEDEDLEYNFDANASFLTIATFT